MTNPTLDDIQKAAQKFRGHNSVIALRAILEEVTGESLTVVSDVPPEKRDAVIAAFEGRDLAAERRSSLLTPDGKALDHGKVWARYNAAGKAAGG
jgi:hypothetical protein